MRPLPIHGRPHGVDHVRAATGASSIFVRVSFQVSLKLGAYRKLSPGPIEEMLFFDHPSGRSRILMAMTWKAEQQARNDSSQPD